MRSFVNIYLLLLVTLTLTACDLFKTRNPEEPDTGRSSFLPPTDASIVIENFKKSIIEKNPENYIACLSELSDSQENHYVFIPSAESMAIYSSIFRNWDIQSERSYLNSLFSSLPDERYPEFTFSGPGFDILQPDSAVYIGEYELVVKHDIKTVPEIFRGTLQFTITPGSNGLWAISRWIDTKKTNNDNDPTWSVLKALFSN